jgi:methylglyoxal synthase
VPNVFTPRAIEDQVGIALVAHDRMKHVLMAWASRHYDALSPHRLYSTETTGALLERDLGLAVHCFRSGPFGGDQEIGGAISRGEVQVLVFFVDPLGVHPHEDDIRALLRLAVLADIVLACNESTAERVIAGGVLGPSGEMTAAAVQLEVAS